MKDERDPQTYAIIGAAMEVHRILGDGSLEQVYHEALTLEFTERGIPYEREYPLGVRYKGQLLACAYRADFICCGQVIVEIKAIEQIRRILIMSLTQLTSIPAEYSAISKALV